MISKAVRQSGHIDKAMTRNEEMEDYLVVPIQSRGSRDRVRESINSIYRHSIESNLAIKRARDDSENNVSKDEDRKMQHEQ